MAADLQQIVNRIKSKQSRLVEYLGEVEAQRDEAMTRVSDLEYTVREQERTIARLSQQVEYLTVVSTVLPSRDDVEKSRALLSGLVREIDKCINDLTD